MAEQRSERNPRSSRCARYAVRGLIVAGFAGVAWLVSTSAAQASDTADFQPGLLSPVTSLLIGGDNHHEGSAGHQQRRGDLVTDTVLTVLNPLTRAKSPVITSPAPVQTVDRAARPAAADASSAKHIRITRPAKAGIKKTHPKRTQEPAVQAVPVGFGSGGDVTAAATGTSAAGVDRKDIAVVSRAAQRLAAVDATQASPVVDRNVVQGTHHVPLLPRPAPVPAPPAAGLTSGAPSSGSGLSNDGAAATLPAVPAGAKVLTFRPDAVEDVELRLLGAERPTVSPD